MIPGISHDQGDKLQGWCSSAHADWSIGKTRALETANISQCACVMCSYAVVSFTVSGYTYVHTLKGHL